MFTNNLVLEPFRKQHIDQFQEMATTSYYSDNQTNEKILSKQKFAVQNKIILSELIDAAERVNKKRNPQILFNSFIRIDGKMASAAFYCDMSEFMSVVRYRISPIFSSNFPYETQQFYKVENSLVGFRAVVHRDYQKHHVFSTHIKKSSIQLYKSGYNSCFGWFTAKNASLAWKSMKAKTVKQVKLEINGQLININYGILDLSKFALPSAAL